MSLDSDVGTFGINACVEAGGDLWHEVLHDVGDPLGFGFL